MNKKIVVIALLALPMSSQVYAGISLFQIDAAMQTLSPSANVWAIATQTTGAVGPATSLASLETTTANAPSSFTGFDIAWYDILNATDFISLTGLPNTTLCSSFFAITLTPTSTSAAVGPTITYNGPSGSYAICELYDSKAHAVPPIDNTPTAKYAPILPDPIATGSAATGYSANRLFSSGVYPAGNTSYYLICAGYSISNNNAVGVELATSYFHVTW